MWLILRGDPGACADISREPPRAYPSGGKKRRALRAHSTLEAPQIAEEALRIAAGICVYTNDQITVLTL